MFSNPVNQKYDLTDATGEIIIILLVAFVLGWFFHWFWARARVNSITTDKQNKGTFAKYSTDDLKIVEGVGPKIEELLKSHGVHNWKELSKSNTQSLKDILKKGGDRFAMHDPASWADQAALAVDGKWSDLAEYQDLLVGGKMN